MEAPELSSIYYPNICSSRSVSPEAAVGSCVGYQTLQIPAFERRAILATEFIIVFPSLPPLHPLDRGGSPSAVASGGGVD